MSIAVNQTVRNNLFVENNLQTPKLSLSSGAFTTSVTSAATSDYDLVLPVDAGTANYLLKTDGAGNLSWTAAAAGDALTANPLSQFATTTSAQLAGVIDDETGTGSLVFGTSPTLTAPVIATIVNTGTLTLPTATTTLVGTGTSDTLTNKTISGASNTISNISLAAAVTGTLPVANGGTGATTLTLGNFLVGAGTSAVTTSKVAPTGAVVGDSDAQTLTFKTISGASNTITNISLTSAVTGTLPVANGGTGSTTSTGTGSVVLATAPTISAPTFSTNFKIAGSFTTTISTAATANYNLVLPATSSTIANGILLGDTLGNLSWSTSAPALTDNPLSQFASTTSAQLAGVISDETGTGLLVFGTSPTLTTPSFSSIVNGGTLTLPTTTDRLVGRDTTDTLTNKTLTAPVIASIVNGGNTLTLPNTTTTLVGTGTSDTLTNKTLTAPIIATISNSGILTLPAGPDTLVGRASADTLTNKNLSDSTTFVVNALDPTKRVNFVLSTATTATTLSLRSSHTAARSITFPDATTTLVGTGTADTLTNKTITAGTNAIDTGAITTGILGVLRGGTGVALSTGSGSNVLSISPTLNAPVIATIVNTGTLTLPTTTDRLVGRDTTDTLTNKTLTAPIIATIVNGGNTLTLPNTTTTLVGTGTSDTLTNKIISGSGAGNTITNINLTTAVTGVLPVANGGTGVSLSTGSGSVVLSTGPSISGATFSGITTLGGTPTFTGAITTPGITITNVLATTQITCAVGGNPGNSLVLPATMGSANNFLKTDGAGNTSWSAVTLDASAITGILSVVNGGTGAATLTSNRFLVGNGTGIVDMSKVAPTGVVVGTTDTQTLSGKTLTAPIIATISNTGTITLPTTTTTLVGTDTVDILTNKTLAAPVIATISNTGTLTLPTGPDTLVGRATVDTLTNKTLTGATISGATNTITNISLTTAVTNTLPVANGGTGVTTSTGTGSVVLSAGSTFTGITSLASLRLRSGSVSTTITSAAGVDYNLILPTAASTVANGCLLSDTSGNLSWSTTTAALTSNPLSQFASTTSAQLAGVISDETGSGSLVFGTSPTLATPSFSSIVNGGTLTLPTSTDRLVGRDTTDTLTNKTLTAPVIATISNGAGTLTLPTATTTLVGTNTSDTLTNKTISGASNTITGISLTAAVAGILPVANGGTGVATLASGNFLVGAGTGVVTTLKAAPAGIVVGTTDAQTLTNKTISGASNTITGISLTAAVAGILPVANGGTGVATLASGNFLVGAGTSAVTTAKVAPAGVVVGTTDAQTLTNKTLTAPIIASIVNTGTLTLPTSTDTLVGRATTDTLTNKTLTDATTTISGVGQLKFDLSLASAGTLTLASVNTLAARTLTFPNPVANDTMISRTSTDTLTNKTLSDLTTSLVSSSDSTKLLKFNMAPATTGFRTTLVFQQSANQSITMPDATDTLVGRATVDTLTNKTISGAANSISIAAASITSGTLAVVRGGTGTTTSTGTGDTVLNTSPTLITPVIASIVNTGTLTLPTSTDTLVGRATTDTLTNKTFSGPVTFSGGSLVNVTGSLSTPLLFLTNGGGGNGVQITTAAATLTAFVFPATLGASNNFLKTDGLGNTSWSAVTLDASAITTGTLAVVRGGTGTTTSTGSGNNVLATSPTLTTPVIASIVNTGTLTLPTSTDTLVGRATADTLTNKDMTSNTNNVAARGLWSNNGAFLVGTYAAAAPVAGQVLAARINPSTFVVDASWQDPAVQYLMRVETSASQVVPGTPGGGTFVVDSSQMGSGMLITVVDQAAYYVVYSAEFSHSSSTGLCRFTIYVDGVAQTDFARVVTSGTNNGVRSIVLSGIVSAIANSVISIRYSTNSNNLTILPRRTIIALKAVT